MKTSLQKRTRVLLATSAALFALVACDQSSPPTVGEKIDSAIEKTEQAASEAKQDIKDAASEVKQESSQAASAIAEGTADTVITTKVKAALAADDQLSAMDISVETTEGVVAMTGTAPSAEAMERASILAKAVDGVSDVQNQLTVVAKQ